MRILRADTNGAAFSGELADGDSGSFQGALDRLEGSDADVPVVDLANVGGISSKCIGVLVAAWAGFMRRSTWFELSASDEVWRQLNEVGAARVFFERPDGMPHAAPPTQIRSELKGTDTDVIAASPATDSRRPERSSASLMAETERYVERLAELELRTGEAEANAEATRAERNDYAIQLRTKEAELEDLRAGLEDRIAEARAEESATRRAYERLSARESELVSSLTELREQAAVVERERDAIAAELKGTRARLAGKKRSRSKPRAAARAGPKKAVGKSTRGKGAKKTPGRHKKKARKNPKKKGKPSGKGARAAKKKTVKKAKHTGVRRKGPVRAK